MVFHGTPSFKHLTPSPTRIMQNYRKRRKSARNANNYKPNQTHKTKNFTPSAFELQFYSMRGGPVTHTCTHTHTKAGRQAPVEATIRH